MYLDQLYTFKQKDMMDYNFFILISYLIDIANILKGEILSCSLMRDYSMGSMRKRFFPKLAMHQKNEQVSAVNKCVF